MSVIVKFPNKKDFNLFITQFNKDFPLSKYEVYISYNNEIVKNHKNTFLGNSNEDFVKEPKLINSLYTPISLVQNKPKLSLRDLLDMYIEENLSNSKNTISCYRHAFVAYFHDILESPICEIDWMEQRRKLTSKLFILKNLKPSSARLYINCLKTIFRWAKSQDILDKNPLQDLKNIISKCELPRKNPLKPYLGKVCF